MESLPLFFWVVMIGIPVLLFGWIVWLTITDDGSAPWDDDNDYA